MPDNRYTITLEHCGYPEPRHVVRFCGDWIGQAPTPEEAEDIRLNHNFERQRYSTK